MSQTWTLAPSGGQIHRQIRHPPCQHRLNLNTCPLFIADFLAWRLADSDENFGRGIGLLHLRHRAVLASLFITDRTPAQHFRQRRRRLKHRRLQPRHRLRIVRRQPRHQPLRLGLRRHRRSATLIHRLGRVCVVE